MFKSIPWFFSKSVSLALFNRFSIVLFLLISSITALIFTKGNSISLLIPFLLFFYFKKHYSVSRIRIKIQEILLIYLLGFLFFFAILGFPIHPSNLNVHFDLSVYAKLAQKLYFSGQENFHSLVSGYYNVNGVSLYHFSDIWFSAFLVKFFSISNSFSLLLITYPILFSQGILCLFELVGDNNKTKIYKYLLILFVLFGLSMKLIGFDSPLLNISYSRYIFSPGLNIYSTKIIILIPIVALFFSDFFKKNYFQSIILLLVICVTYTTTILFCSVFIFFIFFYMLKKYSFKQNFLLFIILLLSYLYFLYLHIHAPSIALFHSSPKINNYSFKSILVIFIELVLQPFLTYLIAIILVIYNLFISKENRFIIIVLFSTIILLSIYISMKHGTPNLAQMLINPVSVFVVVISIYLIFKIEKYQILIMFFLFISSCVNFGEQSLVRKQKIDVFQKRVQVYLKCDRSSSFMKWIVINETSDLDLNSNIAYSFNNIGYFLMYDNRLDYPLDISNFICLNKKEIFQIHDNNLSKIDIIYLKSNKSKEKVLLEWLNKYRPKFILSYNYSFNKKIHKLSSAAVRLKEIVRVKNKVFIKLYYNN